MLDTLIRLLEEGEFRRCLHLAEQLMVQGGWSPSEMALVHLVVCRCRMGLDDLPGAVAAGLLAVGAARAEGEYDLLGRALLYLGTAYVGMQKYDHALTQFYTYLQYRDRYREAGRLEGAIWKHIGVTHQRRLEPEKALAALAKARDWFHQRSIDHGSFTCTHDMLNIYYQMHEVDPSSSLEAVPGLLAFQRGIAKRHPTRPYYHGTYRLNLAAYHLRLGQYSRASTAARRAAAVFRGDRVHAFHCEMILHRCALATSDVRSALGHALNALEHAVAVRAPELERLANQSIADLVRQQGFEVVRRLDAEYLAMGIDLGQYLSVAGVRRDAR